jgi:elongator complex protein 3
MLHLSRPVTEKIPDQFFEEVIRRVVEENVQDKNTLTNIKKDACKGLGLKRLPTDADIAQWLLDSDLEAEYGFLLPLLKIKRTRTVSGVAPVAVMTSPSECPHGKCLCCPGGPEHGTAQSYTGREPSALRAAQHDFDPEAQVNERIRQLSVTGHSTDKIDLIIMGGTFTARDAAYQRSFVKGCFDALNEAPSKDLEEAKANNETAPHRCIGLTVETRPDWFKQEHIDRSLDLGATRVELGVQSVYDDLLENIKRGHTVEDSVNATKWAKDSGLKVLYHMMPGLPGSTPEMDVQSLKTVFKDPRFKPDMLKIYPTLVIEGTELYEMWKRGDYEPLTSEQAAQVVADIKELVPLWVRIQRIQRDIPAQLIEAGVTKSNLRQLARSELEHRGKKCQCIRCREAGHNILDNLSALKPELQVTGYKASGGEEYFISQEDTTEDVLLGFLRLRIPSEDAFRPEMGRATSIVRELKVFGTALPLGEKDEELLQHKGLGKELMEEAERISRELGIGRILVNSGVGVREYYKKMGYELEGVYMGKGL